MEELAETEREVLFRLQQMNTPLKWHPVERFLVQRSPIQCVVRVSSMLSFVAEAFLALKDSYRIHEVGRMVGRLVMCLWVRVHVVTHGEILYFFVSWDRPEFLDKCNLAQGAVLSQAQTGKSRIVNKVMR